MSTAKQARNNRENVNHTTNAHRLISIVSPELGIPFVVKVYINDSANGNSNTLAITSGLGARHFFDAAVVDFRTTPINAFYARQYCQTTERC
jgi:hypothetical protein